MKGPYLIPEGLWKALSITRSKGNKIRLFRCHCDPRSCREELSLLLLQNRPVL